MNPRPAVLALALIVLALFAGPAAAADGALFGGYWDQAGEYWQGVFQKQNGVVMGVLALGVVAMLIITRSGKWQK